MSNTYDIVTISDFRLPGGTNQSTAQELAIHKRLGITTGLLQANSRLSARPTPWSSPILEQLEPHTVVPLLPSESTSATVALLRHPIAIEAMPDVSASFRVDHAMIIANQPALRPSGVASYDAPAISSIVQERLGVDPVWAPIGPVARRSLEGHHGAVSILPDDWTNVFSQSGLPRARTGFNIERPRIGRHSRPQVAKWPASAHEIESAYPESPRYDVRILGGAKPAFNALGRKPKYWTVHPFGALAPLDFLEDIDFWVYFHHPNWSEAYGRAIMEALWSGSVAILPEYMRVTYGDAAVYGTPADVTTIIEEFRAGSRDFVTQSLRGQEFAQAHSPDVHARRIRALLAAHQDKARKASITATPTAPVMRQALTTTRSPVRSRLDARKRPRALFITSNGSGMGHLTRMLGLARALADEVEPVFFSMSQGVSVVSVAGFPYEYVPFSTALGSRSALWHAYFEDRLLAALDQYEPEVIIFDGTWPYKGLVNALAQRPSVRRVWVRRGMWKADVQSPHVTNSNIFDSIIEPGEHAHAYDQGATSKVDNARVVAPMTVLSANELLDRDSARSELGLSRNGSARYALVTLGAGNINDLASTQEFVLEKVRSTEGWDAVLTKAPIAQASYESTIHTVSTFPLARYTRAFDFVVSATGYNSFAEWMVGGLPAVWVPNTSTTTDDQAARAHWASDHGYGVRAQEGDRASISSAMDVMMDDARRARYREKLTSIPHNNGTVEAARMIRDTLASPTARKGAKQ